MSSRTWQTVGVHWQDNSSVLALVGGLLVGVVVVTRYLIIGKISGMSGFLSRTVSVDLSKPTPLARLEKEMGYIFGLVCGGAVASSYLPDCFEDWSSLPIERLVLGGILVGIGTVIGNGCTSGHGICGISSFRLRGLVATCCFMLSSIVTALAANTSTYLPAFENTLPATQAGAIAGVCMLACVVLSVLCKFFAEPCTPNGTLIPLIGFSIDVFCGLVFGLAMAISNMSKISATISFLDLRYWNPALIFVMGGGIAVTASLFFLINRGLQKPLLGGAFATPDVIDIDSRLVVGSLIFGIGWGLAGACPGPAITNLGSGNIPPVIYFFCVVAGMWVAQLSDRVGATDRVLAALLCGRKVLCRVGGSTTKLTNSKTKGEGSGDDDEGGYGSIQASRQLVAANELSELS